MGSVVRHVVGSGVKRCAKAAKQLLRAVGKGEAQLAFVCDVILHRLIKLETSLKLQPRHISSEDGKLLRKEGSYTR